MDKNIIIKLEKLTNTIDEICWFSKIGKKINTTEKYYVDNYINTFNKSLKTHQVKNWEEAINILTSKSWNKKLWEKEENERINLYNLIKKNCPEKVLSKYFGKFTDDTSNIIKKKNIKNLSKKNQNYDYYSRVAIGSAATCCHQTALAIISNKDNHFFIAKFLIFKLGFWPLIITDDKFNIF